MGTPIARGPPSGSEFEESYGEAESASISMEFPGLAHPRNAFANASPALNAPVLGGAHPIGEGFHFFASA